MESSFSKRFTQALEYKNKTMAEISRETGINKASLSQYANSVYTPKQDRIYLIAKALEVSPAWLMGFNTEMDEKPSHKAYKEPVYKDDEFLVYSKTRVLMKNAELFMRNSLLSMTEEKEPTREKMITWLRENWHYAASDGHIYEDMNDEDLYEYYKDAKQTLEKE